MADFDKVIPPGQEGKIAVKITGNKIFPGLVEKSFTVTTNDPENRSFNLTVIADVKKVFEFSKDLSWAGFADEEFKMETIVSVNLTEPVRITGYEWSPASKALGLDQKIAVKLDEIQKGRKYALRISRKKEIPPDRFLGEIILKTDYAKLPQKLVKFNIVITKDVEVHPDRLFYGEMVLQQGSTKTFDRQFTIVAARGDSLKIVQAIPNRDDITVKLQELVAGKSYKGTVWIRPPARIGQYAGSIKLITNYPKYKELMVDIVGSVRLDEAAGKGSGSK